MSKAARTRRTDWFAVGVVEQEPDYQRCDAGGAAGHGSTSTAPNGHLYVHRFDRWLSSALATLLHFIISQTQYGSHRKWVF